ncbi:MAG: SDR family oxidoreductase [Streptosporangiaceae bacterium]
MIIDTGMVVMAVAGLRNMDTPLDAYQVSKAAVVSLTRSLAEQLGPQGIRANTVCPGAILTPMTEPLYTESPDRRASMEARTRSLEGHSPRSASD